ncbi:MAG: tetraacyldisaccharide 4'-kinase [Edaphobacter sp.]|uniref:tetraacyldisaccharide 4'-kinase n=1 Tax=Edaphobacter sp. TaxID=1934404 RepID=UPI002390830A|nr:tetraacyldisaccharide 4'-kinase [Edaphobacter sp.]MDE1176130.1 tetraacyldisaccharide 4'-kinase [Edaphobacter sp.]
MSVRRPWLIPLTPLYSLVVVVKRRLYQWGWVKQNRLTAPVISIGSVSAGGAGKTPFVAMLATMLQSRGYAVSILTRGYGRTSELIERVEPYDDPLWHGDEPVLLAQSCQVPVWAGADRYEAGLRAEQDKPKERIAVHLLDDGFQHLRLGRSVDIVLLTVEDTEDVVLPAGNLREPLHALRDASIVVIREDEEKQLRQELEELREESSDTEGGFKIWVIRRSLSLLEGMETILPTTPLAFCGIARPENFTKMLITSCYEPMETMAFPDHHPYSEEDVTRLVDRARQIGANGFVTTEKDAVKFTPKMRTRLAEIGPLIIAKLRVTLVSEKEAFGQLVGLATDLDRRKNRERR